MNAVAPGPIDTELVQNLSPAWRQSKLAELPLGRFGEPDDVAWGAVYLASDEAKFVTGAELVIDGGYTAR